VGWVLADRLDRRCSSSASTSRAPGSSPVLAATIVTRAVGVGVILVAMLLLGVGEVFADWGSPSIRYAHVDRIDAVYDTRENKRGREHGCEVDTRRAHRHG
jgi:hypothetical protein